MIIEEINASEDEDPHIEIDSEGNELGVDEEEVLRPDEMQAAQRE